MYVLHPIFFDLQVHLGLKDPSSECMYIKGRAGFIVNSNN